jgi:ribosomal protein S27E
MTLPWEDGNNPYTYVKCPNCGEENTLYGFGEDDD